MRKRLKEKAPAGRDVSAAGESVLAGTRRAKLWLNDSQLRAIETVVGVRCNHGGSISDMS